VELGCHGFDKLTMTNPQYVVHCHPELVEGCVFFMSWPPFTEWLHDGFTKKYNVHSLVWYEIYESAEAAINREKQIKKWKRKWKLELIEKNNPAWNDLYDDFCEKACPELDSGTGFLLPQE
jgi:hypothetical protein